jgi:cell division cycle 14
MSEADLKAALEVLPGRLWYVVVRTIPHAREGIVFVDAETPYFHYPFFSDFGPYSLGNLARFSAVLHAALHDAEHAGKRVYAFSGPHVHRRANAVYLLAAYTLLHAGRSAEEAFRPFSRIRPALPPWHDATPGLDTFHLTTQDVLRGICRARDCGFFPSLLPITGGGAASGGANGAVAGGAASPAGAASQSAAAPALDVAEYEHFEKVENGDLNWVVDGRFLAFAGPHDVRTRTPEGYCATGVDDLLPYFRRRGVSAVVRLNKKYYNKGRFTAVGIDHHDLYYLDGSNPPEAILQRFLAICESTPGE